MDFSFPDEVLQFGQDVRLFLQAELPSTIAHKIHTGRAISHDEHVLWQRILHSKGWAAPSWPVEYGGTGWDALRRHVFNEVMTEEGAPTPIPFGQLMIAPIIMNVGTQAQKDFYLPRILTLEHWFCQGYSESGAGSDLASLKTSAVLDGDEWIINGQKTWTSGAQYANQMFCLVRTDPAAPKPQMGISMLIFPMNLPGMTVRPIITLNGEHTVNEVFFDDVRVPMDSLIGEVNLGWTYAKMLLGHERTTIAGMGQGKRLLRRLKKVAREQKLNGVPLIEVPSFRQRIAEAEIELKSLEVTGLRMIAGIGRNAPGTEANMLKIRGSELQQCLAELILEATGPNSLRHQDPTQTDDDDAVAARQYLMNRVLSIYGGSNEIQHNILAKSLGL